MDLFGIGQALRACAEIYFRSARGAGRTTAMLESVKDGDRIIFADCNEADRVRGLCRERELDVECIVISVNYPEKIFERCPCHGRTVFDHRWVEDRYILAIERCEKDIDFFARESSGYGEAHRETAREATEHLAWENSKWRF